MQELRLYTFTNFYLSAIQHGIQSAHLVHELFNKYLGLQTKASFPEELEVLKDWSLNHKTMIVKNGGDLLGLEELYQNFNDAINDLKEKSSPIRIPTALFEEDERSLGGILTCVGLIVSSDFFNAIKFDRLDKKLQFKLSGQLLTKDDYILLDDTGDIKLTYKADSPEAIISSLIQSLPLAR